MKRSIAMLLIALAIAGCGRQEAVAPADEAAALAQFRKPSFAMQDGMEYGYETVLSAEDKQRGLAAAPLQMYRFLGRAGDKYQVAMRKGEVMVVYEASAPFEFVKAYAFMDDRVVDTQTLHLPRNAVASLALKDALYGNMAQYHGSRAGKNGHLMFDAQAQRIVFVPDHS